MTPDDADLVLPPMTPPTTRLWVDAYTMQLEAMAEAIASPKVRKSAEDALKRIQADLAIETDPNKAADLRAALQNQQKILLDIGTFDLEGYRSTMAAWRRARDQILSAGWDLTQEIHFEVSYASATRERSSVQIINIFPEGGKKQPFMAGEGQAVLCFIQFVAANQERFDPLSYTKQMLTRQGITADNFDDHRDRLCVDNPWAPSPTPAARPKIIQGNFKP